MWEACRDSYLPECHTRYSTGFCSFPCPGPGTLARELPGLAAANRDSLLFALMISHSRTHNQDICALLWLAML
ncbi:hypothetical protein PoB_000170600, partial [Plakobranchus ocellatus]